MRDLSWPDEWKFLATGFSSFRGTIMVLAPLDRGKSTLIRLLYVFFLREGRRVGWVDSDLGQSTVGPPTTIGLVISRGKEATPEERLFTPYFRFIGDTTPEHEIVATACYAAELARLASARCDVVLFDTCGLFSYPSGYFLKMLKIRLTEPEVVLAVGEKEEFLLWQRFLRERLLVLPLPKEVAAKQYEFRRGYRQQLFNRYFTQKRMLTLPLEALRFSLPYYPYFFESILRQEKNEVFFLTRGEKLVFSEDGNFLVMEKRGQRIPVLGMLCGIFSKEGKELGLGIIHSVNLEKETVTVWGVCINPGKPGALVPGCLRLNEHGEEKGRYLLFSSPLRLERW
ncbi:MAG: Clp1/GlmU family protein [Atribacterota bacterium]